MERIETTDSTILKQLLPAFRAEHLRGGMAFATTAAEVMGVSSSSAVHWIGLNVATAILWLDHRIDSEGSSTHKVADQEATLSILSLYVARSGAPRRMRQLWTETLQDTMAAIAGPPPDSYAEHLQTGARSVGFAHCVATLALAFDLDISARMEAPDVQSTIEQFARAARLDNDLRSIAKERSEKNPANAVLLLQPTLRNAATGVVRLEVERYRARARFLLSRLDKNDPVVLPILATLAGATAFYDAEAARYLAFHKAFHKRRIPSLPRGGGNA